MSFEIYKIIHIAGLILLFVSLGALIATRQRVKPAIIGHGVALLLLLLGGFGLQAKLYPGQFPGWMIAKIAIWLVLGASLAWAKGQKMPTKVLAPLVVALGVIAAVLAVFKPF